MGLLDGLFGLLPGLTGYRYMLVPISTEYPWAVYFDKAEHYKTWAEAQPRVLALREYMHALNPDIPLASFKVMVLTAQEG